MLNEIPDYGEELAKCRRYFKPLPKDAYMSGWINEAIGVIHIPFDFSDMRATPTVVVLTEGIVLTVDGAGYRVPITINTDFTFSVRDLHIGLILTEAGTKKLANLKLHALGVWGGTLSVFLDANL